MADTPTEAERNKAILDFVANASKGGSPTVSAPATQQFLARWDENRVNDAGVKEPGFVFYKNDNYVAPKPAAPTTPQAGSPYGTYGPDPDNPGGPWKLIVPPQTGTPANLDEQQLKAVENQLKGAERDEIARNEAAGKGRLTDKQVMDLDRLSRDTSINAGTLKLQRDKFEADNQREADKLAIEQAKLPGTLAQTTATTTKIGAETDLTRAQIVALGIKTASDADRAVSAGKLDDAQAAKIKAELLKGEPVTAPTDQPFIMRRDPNGQLITEQNQNYQGPKAPTTRGELAQRVALLQSQAMQMKDKIQADKSIPPDQQAARFATWYDQNVAPQAGALEQQQQSIIQDENLKAIEQQRTNLASASSAMSGLMPYRVGPGYGQAFEKIVQDTANTKFAGAPNQAPLDLGTGWSTFKGPNLDEHIKNLVGAQTAPAPGMDLQGMLNRDQWMPGGTPPAGGPPAPGAPAPTPGPPANTNPNNNPLGAIGNDPMLAAIQARNRLLASQQTAAATGNPNNSPFGAIGPGGMPPPMPPPAVMPLASGSGPLPYAQFNGVLPALPNFDYSQVQNPYQWPFGGGGGGNAGFTAGP